MRNWGRTGLVIALGVGGWAGTIPSPARAQVVRERDTTITGPRGNSVTRDLKSVRGPGFLDRQTTITRPGGSSMTSNTLIRRPGPAPFAGRGFGPGPGWGPRPGWGPGPRFFPGPSEVIVNGGGGGGNGLLGLGIGAAAGTGLGFLLGRATSPQPVVVAQPVPVPVAPVAAAPPVEYVAPQPYQAAQPGQPNRVVVDPVAMAAQRLSSTHEPSRRDGVVTLGRLRDPRAIPPLVDRLKNDKATEVRVAAATALGDIGDPQAAVYLERSVVYDKKDSVRNAASAALAKLPRPGPDGALVGGPAGNDNVQASAAAVAPGATSAPGLAPLPNSDSYQPVNVPPVDSGERVPPPPTPYAPR